jgi:outer membrane protein TolC
MNGAFGQKAYTLDECIQAALTNNVRMKNANNELEMAKQDKKKAFTNYFPSVSAAGTGFMADTHVISALVKKRAELRGDIIHYKQLLSSLDKDLQTIDATIKIFDDYLVSYKKKE